VNVTVQPGQTQRVRVALTETAALQAR
jgi:hypothetical protein